MPNSTDRGRKLLVRTALVTSVTVATLIGAQNLAMLDQKRFELSQASSGNPDLILLPPPSQPENQTSLVAGETARPSEIRHVAPNLVILRQPGVVNADTPPATNTQNALVNGAILPPNPVALAAPAPVIVQQPGQVIVQQAAQVSAPAPAPSHSSR